MKKALSILVTIIAATAFGVFLGSWINQPKDNGQTTHGEPVVTEDSRLFAAEYSGVTKDNNFIIKTPTEVVKILEGGTGLIYFGFPECPWCQAYVNYLDEVAREEKLDKMYYVNIREIRTNNTEEYQRMTELLKDYLGKGEDGNPRIFVPAIVAVDGGKIIGFDSTSSMNTREDGAPDEWWTKPREGELKQKLRVIIKDVKACGSVCSS